MAMNHRVSRAPLTTSPPGKPGGIWPPRGGSISLAINCAKTTTSFPPTLTMIMRKLLVGK